MLPAILGIVIGALSFGSLSVNTTEGAARRDLGCVLDLSADPGAARPQDLAARMAAPVALVRPLGLHVHARPRRWPADHHLPVAKKIDRMQFMAITVVFFTVVNAVKLRFPFACSAS